jgi:hypothetical protein
VEPDDFVSEACSQLMVNVINPNQFNTQSLTITFTFSCDSDPLQMLNQQNNQAIPSIFTQAIIQLLISLSTEVSIQFLGRKLEIVSLNDSAVGSGQHTERKTKNLGNIGIDIETDLREIEKENPSQRISEGLEATTSEQ